MKVFFIPDFRRTIPYQTALANALSRRGAEVVFNYGSQMSFVVRTLFDIDHEKVLHLHWLGNLIHSGFRPLAYLRSFFLLLWVAFLKLTGVKIVWTAHNIVGHDTALRGLESFTTKAVTRMADRVIVHTRSGEKEVERAYAVPREVLTVIPQGNYLGWYADDISREAARDKLGIGKEEKVLLFFGMVMPYKGIFDLIKAFKDSDLDGTRLLIAGKPGSRETAEKVSRESSGADILAVLRFIPDEEVQVYMRAADAVVLPYREVLTSGAVMLAMCFEKPVIAPVAGCIPDILDRSGAFLYAPGRSRELERALKAFAETRRGDLEKMGEYNLCVAKRYDWDNIGETTFNMYKELFGEKSAGK